MKYSELTLETLKEIQEGIQPEAVGVNDAELEAAAALEGMNFALEVCMNVCVHSPVEVAGKFFESFIGTHQEQLKMISNILVSRVREAREELKEASK